jgi:uncharacterized protein with PIN domain
MMDGRAGAIRAGLDAENFEEERLLVSAVNVHETGMVLRARHGASAATEVRACL